MVGQALATRLMALGHEVCMGSRSAGNATGAQWAAQAGAGASHGTFADAAEFGEVVINATPGGVSLAALDSAGAAHLAGKVLIDVANPLDASHGMPPVLTVVNTDSVGEQIQRAFPDTFVVKTLNTVNAGVMVDPGRVPPPHEVFVSGDDTGA